MKTITQSRAKQILKHIININKYPTRDQLITGGKYSKGEILTALKIVVRADSDTMKSKQLSAMEQDNLDKGKPRKHGFNWTENEKQTLIKAAEENIPLDELVDAFGRTSGALIDHMPKGLMYLYSEYQYNKLVEDDNEIEKLIDKSFLHFPHDNTG